MTTPSTPPVADDVSESGEFVLVPREPTEAMIDAARHFLEPATERIGRAAWNAMIAASLSPQHIGDAGGVREDGARALCLLQAEDARNDKIHELLETIREQIRVDLAPEHRPEGLMTNIQNAVYAMRGRTRLMDDSAITAPLAALPPARVEAAPRVKSLEWVEGDVQSSATSPFGAWYFVHQNGDEWFIHYSATEGYSSRDEAKAAAQADYEARILSALQSEQPK